MLRVAKRLGWAAQGDNGRTLPTQTTKLDDLKQAVNDAAEWFWNGAGRQQRWRWLSRPLTIALATTAIDPRSRAGSLHEFVLGPDVAGPGQGEVNAYWTAGTSSGAVRRRAVSEIDRLLSESPGNTGSPERYALDRIDVAGAGVSAGMAWVLKVYPKPDATYTLSVPVRRAFVPLSDTNQAVYWPKDHDRAIVLRAVIEAQASGPLSEAMDLATARGELAEALADSIRADNRIDGASRGQLVDTSDVEEGAVIGQRRPRIEDCSDLDGSPAFTT